MLVGGFVTSPLRAQSTFSDPVLLRTPASVRFSGLHGAGAALVGHAGAVFTNPAGLATIRHIAVEGGYRSAEFGGYVASAALGARVGQFDVGGGLQHFDASTLPGSANETLVVGSLVYRFGLIAVGTTGKYMRASVNNTAADGASLDIGVALAVFDIMALGFSVQNVTGNWQSNSLLAMPRTTRTGFTMNYVDPLGSFRLLSTIEWQWPEGQDSRFVVGGEAGVVLGGVGVVGRLAHATRPEGSELPAFTYGGTLELVWADVDYAFEPRPITSSDVHRLGLRVAF